MEWGNHIRELASFMGLSNRQLARESGVHYQTIQAWLKRDTVPDSTTALRFVRWIDAELSKRTRESLDSLKQTQELIRHCIKSLS